MKKIKEHRSSLIGASLSVLVLLYGCNQNESHNSTSMLKRRNVIIKEKNIVPKTDSSFVKIDSIKVGINTFDYQLLFHSTGKTTEVYRVRNQDHSIEFTKSYIYPALDYVNYEVSDLPTGLIWNILHHRTSNTFYITDKYDIHAIGDTIDRKSINFSQNVATVISTGGDKKYKIRLKRIWPK